MITIRWCAGALFFLALVPAFLGVRDWLLAAFMFAAFVVAFTPWPTAWRLRQTGCQPHRLFQWRV